MRLSNQYLFVGLSWALLLVPAAFFGLVGIAGGVSWLWLFGDNPWPKWTQWAIPSIGFVGGVLATLICIGAAYVCDRQRETPIPPDSQTERRKIAPLIAVPLLLILMLVGELWNSNLKYQRDVANAALRIKSYATLATSIPTIRVIDVNKHSDGIYQAKMTLTGKRKGEYRLKWRVTDNTYRTSLLVVDQIVSLRSSIHEATFTFPADELAKRYQMKVLKGGGGVLVE